MSESIKSILFATDLSINCKPALEVSVSLAAIYNANLYLLHVIDTASHSNFDEHFQTVLGHEKWMTLKREYEMDASNALIGKMSARSIGKKAIQQFSNEFKIESTNPAFRWQEIVATGKNLVDTIVSESDHNKCNLIILGTHSKLFGGNYVGNTIKGVLKKSKVPILVVPPPDKE